MQIPSYQRRKVKEITLDTAPAKKLIASTCFTKAVKVIDRFHVLKLALEAMQEIRIKHRWEAIDMENEAILRDRQTDQEYVPKILVTGDTRKELLTRSCYLLYESRDKWTLKQGDRAQVLFKEYPEIERASNLSQELREFFNIKTGRGVALTKLARLYEKVEK